jgi:hypothetical protein
MPTWTISAPKDFQESVKETARKLGKGIGEYFRMAHQTQLNALTSADFERAKKLMELNESKGRLGSLRERETLLLREKGYKDKNVQRILKDVDDPEIKEEIERLAKMREEEANTQLRLHEELNPIGKKQLGHPPKFRESSVEIAKPLGHAPKNVLRNDRVKQTRMAMFGLNDGQYKIIEDYAKHDGISWNAAKKKALGED